MRRVALSLFLVGCGPAVGDSGGPNGQSDSATTDENTTIIGGSSGVDDDESSTSSEEDSSGGEGEATGEDEGEFVCPTLVPQPPGTNALCSADPNAIPPIVASYGGCYDATVSFRQSWASNGTFLFYDATAAFWSARAYPEGLTVLDPYDGTVGDCGLYYGSHSAPDSKTYEDVGTVTFSFGPESLTGSKNVDDAGRVRYSANAADAELDPQWLQPHGITVSNGEGSTLELSDALTLPEEMVLTGTLGEGGVEHVLDRDAITITWQPGRSGFPVYAHLWAMIEGTDRLTLLCRMEDDGEFTLPPEFACQFPAVESALLGVARVDHRLVSATDGRTVLMNMQTYLGRSVMLE